MVLSEGYFVSGSIGENEMFSALDSSQARFRNTIPYNPYAADQYRIRPIQNDARKPLK